MVNIEAFILRYIGVLWGPKSDTLFWTYILWMKLDLQKFMNNASNSSLRDSATIFPKAKIDWNPTIWEKIMTKWGLCTNTCICPGFSYSMGLKSFFSGTKIYFWGFGSVLFKLKLISNRATRQTTCTIEDRKRATYDKKLLNAKTNQKILFVIKKFSFHLPNPYNIPANNPISIHLVVIRTRTYSCKFRKSYQTLVISASSLKELSFHFKLF